MSDPVITVENISKRYRLGEIRSSHTLAETLAERFRNRYKPHKSQPPLQPNGKNGEILWALKDVSFSVERGEVLGIIGRNGAGKSTLLKIMSRITEPTSGEMEIRGRVGSLLEVGTGFHPELTGRENVFLNGAILGMSRADIARQFDEIVDFSEVSKFIDTPVKRYSSGMYTRLAFAVAAHLDSPILIVDEVLSVGDAAFQKKCLGKINNMTRSGKTVVFVSHNMGAISELCSKVVLMHHGTVRGVGPTEKMLEAYVQLMGQMNQGGDIPVDENARFSFISIATTNRGGQPTEVFDIMEDVVIRATYRLREAVRDLSVAAIISRNMAEIIFANDTDNLPSIEPKEPGLYTVVCRIPGMFLKAGGYSVRMAAGTADTLFQDIEFALTFEIEEFSHDTRHKGYRKDRPGVVVSPALWTTTQAG